MLDKEKYENMHNKDKLHARKRREQKAKHKNYKGKKDRPTV